MAKRYLWLLMFLLYPLGSVDAVTLRVQTTDGDSVFYAPVGDTVSVAVSIDSDTLALAGVEVFLGYDARLFAPVAVAGVGGLLGRVLVDTSFVVSDSLAVIHVAEADLVGRSTAGDLFTVHFEVLTPHAGFSQIGIVENDGLRTSAYTEASRTGATSTFDTVHHLQFRDLPPVLTLPVRFGMLEDEVLIVSLRDLAQDVESDSDALRWDIASSDSLVAVIVTDTMTAQIVPAPNVAGSAVLTFTVTDPAGGFATQMVPLRVGPANDAPEIVAGVLPDSLQLIERSARIALDGGAVDIDGDTLIWSGEGEGGVSVEIDNEAVAQVFAPLDWVGEGVVVLRVTDPSGATAWHAVRILREVALNTLPGDFDGSGDVGFPDFVAFAQAFGQENPSLEADLNGDGRVDFGDFLIFIENFGRTN